MKLQRRTSGMRWTRCAGKQTMSSISIIHLSKLDKQKRRNVEEIDADHKLQLKSIFHGYIFRSVVEDSWRKFMSDMWEDRY